jgi:lysophospholipase L1-like esterase
MSQILIMGASTVYGVGGAHGGWADLVKLHLHEEMYAKNMVSEAHEVHIFAKPDATVHFVVDTYERYIADYRRNNRKTVVILSIGMNDTKAIDSPDNYLNTPQAYKQSMTALLNGLAKITDAVLCVGFASVDESRTSPKLNPFTGKHSYFTNKRIQMFNAAFEEAVNSSDANATYVDLVTQTGDDWPKSCLSADGLHPNDTGHRRIFDKLMPQINRLISP